MRKIRRLSLPSFVAGAAVASVLVSIPAIAAVTGSDQNPTVFDGTTPTLTVQPVVFALGQSIPAANDGGCGDGVPTFNDLPDQLRWNATDATSGVASYDVAEDEYTEEQVEVRAEHTTATSWNLTLSNYNSDCGGGFYPSLWWITARDYRGNEATSSTVSDYLNVWDSSGVDHTRFNHNIPVTRTGTWSTAKCTCFNLGTTTYSTAKNASISYTVQVATTGQTLAVVAPTSSNRGVMNISVDGGTAQAVSTNASTTFNRVVVWQKTLAAGSHTLKITNAGTSGHGRIDVDSIMLGPAWSGDAPPRNYPDD